jgi:hypothetical protein
MHPGLLEPQIPTLLRRPLLSASTNRMRQVCNSWGRGGPKTPAVRRPKLSCESGFKIFSGPAIFLYCARSSGVMASPARVGGPSRSGRSWVPRREGWPALPAVFGGGEAPLAGGGRPSRRARRPPPGIPGPSSGARDLVRSGGDRGLLRNLSCCQRFNLLCLAQGGGAGWTWLAVASRSSVGQAHPTRHVDLGDPCNDP